MSIAALDKRLTKIAEAISFREASRYTTSRDIDGIVIKILRKLPASKCRARKVCTRPTLLIAELLSHLSKSLPAKMEIHRIHHDFGVIRH